MVYREVALKIHASTGSSVIWGVSEVHCMQGWSMAAGELAETPQKADTTPLLLQTLAWYALCGHRSQEVEQAAQPRESAASG